MSRLTANKAPAADAPPRFIFLVGARASGKTSLGQLLARALHIPFADTDARLQRTYGKTIAQIVAEDGWPVFRRYESCTLRELPTVYPAGCVIATGGGIVLDATNRHFMRCTGTVLYLEAAANLLEVRLRQTPLDSQRPPLADEPAANNMACILATRRALYEETAHFRLHAANPLPEICAHALHLLRANPQAGRETA